VLDLPVYDHVIVGGERYVSFAEAGCCARCWSLLYELGRLDRIAS
jgi:hypothetical protein